jgi:hypothetical protein
MGVHQSCPSMTLISLCSGSTIFTEVSLFTWKNTPTGKAMLRAATFASSSASEFLLLSLYSTVKSLK